MNTSRYAVIFLGSYYAIEDRVTGHRLWRGKTEKAAWKAQKRFSEKLKLDLYKRQT